MSELVNQIHLSLLLAQSAIEESMRMSQSEAQSELARSGDPKPGTRQYSVPGNLFSPDEFDQLPPEARDTELGMALGRHIAWLASASRLCHYLNRRWWQDPSTGQPLQRNVGELIALVHSEMSEALEGHRKGLMDDKLPTRSMIEVELADALIRIMDMADGLGLDLAGAWAAKCQFNLRRHDHTHEARLAPGGKAY